MQRSQPFPAFCARTAGRAFGAAALALVFALLAAVGSASVAAAEPAPSTSPAPPELSLERRIIAVSKELRPLVVHIEAIVKVNDRRNQVTGSGLIATPEGLILTNQHVVEKAEKVEVSVPGRKARYVAEVIGTDKQTDIAVLRIRPEQKLPTARFARTDDVRVGQWVLAIGNPYGLDGTVSLGIVSAKGRNLEIPDLLNDFIQTDAMIDRGSSGGPLVDLDGRVVGINSRGQGRGIGFTIPVDTVLEVMGQIERGGIERGWMGITMQPLDRDLAHYFGIPDVTGVIVNGVSSGSPAERAKLQPGDILVRFGERSVEAEKEEDLGTFQRWVAELAPGETVPLVYVRDGRERKVKVKLASQPRVEPEESETDLGFHVQEITERLYREQRLDSRRGAYVSFVARGSPAAVAGVFPGDVIERVADQEVRDLEGFDRAIERVAERVSVLITARRGGDIKFLLVKRGARPSAPADHADDAGEAAHRP